jgi:hypothetical protein
MNRTINMKIFPPHKAPEIGSQKTVGKTSLLGSGPSFGKVLDQAVDRQASVAQPTQAMPINRPQMVSNSSLTTPQASATQVEASLEALEVYRSALADPHTTLRQMESLHSSLELQRQSMETALENLPTDNPLRQIGVQTSAAIIVEQGRFRSGVYN